MEGEEGGAAGNALRRVGIVMLAAWAAVAAGSWLKSDLTTNDFERLGSLWLSALFFALFAVLLLAYLQLAEIEVRTRRRAVWVGFAALAAAALCTFPIGSKDIFFYSFYGKMWGAYGANPHLLAPADFATDPWFRFLQVWTNRQPTPYGPAFTLQMRVLYALSGGSLALLIAEQKLLGVVLVAAAAVLLARLRPATASDGAAADVRWLALWLWSPLVLFDGVATPHNDLAMSVLLLAACLLWLRERPTAAAAMLALSFWYKWYALLLAPVWLFWTLRRWGPRARLRTSAAAAVAVSALVLLPFAGALPAMAQRVLGFHGMRQIFPDELPPPLWLLFRALDAVGLLSSGTAWFDAIRAAALIGGLAWLLWRRRAAAWDGTLFLRDCLWSLALFFTLVPTMLWPWHLTALCAFALATGGRAGEWGAVALAAAGLLSYFLTFRYATLACALVAFAFWAARHRRWVMIGDR